ncbi:helix-turn-helix domain-containing protein [Burkholderia cepacia]|uniref:helix-turn-helix domain-containing protein n=1 Tax=Burkholderia cepacia TaxID=292 RepID=UPI0012D9D036|nr:helix-turn-helix transcriptional regulator [Burkholderia cepacia]
MKIWTAEEEGSALGRRFEGIDRADFARRHNLSSSASLIYQHITGRRPISMKAAVEYAAAFGCPLDEISPRIALEVEEAARLLGSNHRKERPNVNPEQSPDDQTLEKSPPQNHERPPKDGDNMLSLVGISKEMRAIIEELATIDRSQGRRRGILIGTIGAIIATTETDADEPSQQRSSQRNG